MEFDLKDEHPGYYPETQDLWRYFAAPYALNALKSGEVRLCERCAGLRLDERLKKRQCFSDDPFVPAREEWGDNFFDITISKSVVDPCCSFCNIFASLTTQRPKLEFLNVFLPTGSNGYFKMQLEEEGTPDQMRIKCHQHGHTAQNLLDYAGWPKDAKTIDWARLKEYISFCDTHHGDTCFPPERLLVTGLRLYNCDTGQLENAPKDAKYAVLSYVWGGTSYPGKDQPLPKTIDDAVKTAKALGYTYIWVDQVCIDQDDSDKKMEQILQMDLIYQNADLTIVAASSDSAAHGIHGVSDLSRPAQKLARFGEHVILQLASIPGDVPNIRFRRFKWSTRAWTFQEEILSRRLLYLADNTACFVCCVIEAPFAALEGLPRPELERYYHQKFWRTQRQTKRKGIHDKMDLKRRVEHFSELIGQYTVRNLSYSDDILNGFTGILQVFQRMESSFSHLWGAPIIELPEVIGNGNDKQQCLTVQGQGVIPCGLLPGLKWIVPNPGGNRRENFPSWSWTGWEMETTYNWQGGERDGIDGGISVGVEMINGDILPWPKFHQMEYLRNDGRSKSRFIHLNLWATKVKVSANMPLTEVTENSQLKAVLETLQGEEYTTSWTPTMNKLDWPGDSSREFTALILTHLDTKYFKFLVFVEEKKAGWFERVGALEMTQWEPSLRLFKLERRQIRLG